MSDKVETMTKVDIALSVLLNVKSDLNFALLWLEINKYRKVLLFEC